MSVTLERLRRGDLAGARTLDLSGCGLTAFPREVLDLADTLEILDLGRNAIDALPHDVARLGRLRVLFASGTPFAVLPPVLGDCAALTQIGFRGSGVEIVPAEALPPRLRWLTLTDNRIAELPDAIGCRPDLQKLMLAGNRLATLPATLGDAPGLELLRLASNRFERLPAFLATLPRLAWLAFAGNPVSTARSGARSGAGTGAGAGSGNEDVIAWSALTLQEPLGEGSSGRVHAAIRNRTNTRVAFKLFKGSVSSDGLPEHEIAAAMEVGGHPHLLGAQARVDDHPSGMKGLVLELLPRHWVTLAGPPSLETCTRDIYDPTQRISGPACLRIASAIAHAGAHLAGLGLMHGDLYAHNIHWDGAAGIAKLGDLGAATRVPPGAGHDALFRSDVLAWGILAHELMAMVQADASDALDRLRPIAHAAISANPFERPEFADITAMLA